MNEPADCIYCKADGSLLNAETIHAEHYSRRVTCSECERWWYEIFAFTGIIRDDVEVMKHDQSN